MVYDESTSTCDVNNVVEKETALNFAFCFPAAGKSEKVKCDVCISLKAFLSLNILMKHLSAPFGKKLIPFRTIFHRKMVFILTRYTDKTTSAFLITNNFHVRCNMNFFNFLRFVIKHT